MESAYTTEKFYTLAPGRASSNSDYGADWGWMPGLAVGLCVLAIFAVTIYITLIYCERRRVPGGSTTNGQEPNTPEIIQYGSGFGGCSIV